MINFLGIFIKCVTDSEYEEYFRVPNMQCSSPIDTPMVEPPAITSAEIGILHSYKWPHVTNS